jgi:branched-subunit amino acid aminotransferase/4-amino-4-deoxychorismate lyase
MQYIAPTRLGMEIVERDIDRTELYTAEEAFFCGSG